MSSAFTKEDTKNLYGIAVLLMIFHHLFCIPDRLEFYIPLLEFEHLHIETAFAWFCKICVGIYAFISGYGFYVSAENCKSTNIVEQLFKDYQMVFRHLIRFYKKYWIVFLIFVPMGFLFFKVPFEPTLFIKSFLGKSADYNHEWWYVWQYIKFIILFPFAKIFVKKSKYKLFEALKSIGIAVGTLILLTTNPITPLVEIILYQKLGFYFLIFVVGMYCVRFRFFEKLDQLITHNKKSIFYVGILVTVVSIRIILANKANYNAADVVLVPFFAYAVCRLLSRASKSNGIKILQLYGKYSMYIWLTHTFFAYYYFQKFVLLPKYSVLIFIWLSMLMLLCGYCLDRVESIVNLVINKVRCYHRG